MKKASLLALLAVPFLLQSLPAIAKTTPPREVCERTGGKWDAEEQQCIRAKPNPKFKGDKWTVKR